MSGGAGMWRAAEMELWLYGASLLIFSISK